MTYSIVARDPANGEMGIAVQSHWFSVGSVVPWAEAGIGAVATQGFAEVSYGPLALGLLRAGRSAEATLAALTSIDEEAELRQVAIVDARGRVAVHTGERCIAEAGHAVGEQVTCQANMMWRDTVPAAMLAAYEGSVGRPLGERLILALEAAQAEGGDIRGQQSAALLTVAANGSGRPWQDRLIELRVEDHDDPNGELRRLLALHRGYEQMSIADDLLARGDVAGASAGYRAARATPGLDEAAFWHAVVLAREGEVTEARAVLSEASDRADGWRALLTRLPASGLLPADVVDDLLRP